MRSANVPTAPGTSPRSRGDVQKYEGWRDVDVDADYRASKSVHTIVTLGYLEYHEGTLVLTDKGRMLMQNVAPVQAVPTD